MQQAVCSPSNNNNTTHTCLSFSAKPDMTSSSSCFFWLLNITASCISPVNGSTAAAAAAAAGACCTCSAPLPAGAAAAALLLALLLVPLPLLLALAAVLLLLLVPARSALSRSRPALKFCSATSVMPIKMRSVAVCRQDSTAAQHSTAGCEIAVPGDAEVAFSTASRRHTPSHLPGREEQ